MLAAPARAAVGDGVLPALERVLEARHASQEQLAHRLAQFLELKPDDARVTALGRQLGMRDAALASTPGSEDVHAVVGEVLDLMARLAADGMTMLVVTHEIDFARDVSDRTIFIDQGLIEEQGPSREVLTNPRTERMQRFLERVLHRVRVE